MSYFEKHIFFCQNIRDDGREFCGGAGTEAIQKYAKKRVKALGLSGAGHTRINAAGCLDRCEHGPCMVVYPEATWYTFVDQSDVDEIIMRHVQGGEVVTRLLIPKHTTKTQHQK